DMNIGRSGNFMGTVVNHSYPHSSSGYGYQNIASGSAMPPPFPSTIFTSGGPIPYMVDSRGAPVIPQIISPAAAAALPSGFSQTPPFFINMG
ncbi:hypothetical protein M569_09257, partial [Genlisea aurea]